MIQSSEMEMLDVPGVVYASGEFPGVLGGMYLEHNKGELTENILYLVVTIIHILQPVGGQGLYSRIGHCYT